MRLLGPLVLFTCLTSAIYAQETKIQITPQQSSIGMGECVVVHVKVSNVDGSPATNQQLLPYLDGKRWGAHVPANENGEAQLLIPIPDPGKYQIAIQSRAEKNPLDYQRWIWSTETKEDQDVYLQKIFSLQEAVKEASLWIAVDDTAEVFINGSLVATQGGWRNLKPFMIDPKLFRVGENYIGIHGVNGTGPAGVLFKMDLQTASGAMEIVSDESWTQKEGKVELNQLTEPIMEMQPVANLGAASSHLSKPEPWPNFEWSELLFVGQALPQNVNVSDPITIEVKKRELIIPKRDSNSLFAIQWEGWFTKNNITWSTAEGVPLLGFYWSEDRRITRQHLIWLMESGVDSLVVDWSNHIWYLTDWNDISVGSHEILYTTDLLMEELAAIREAGYPAPTMSLLIGISHIRPDGPNAVNGQLAHIYKQYVENPKFKGLYQEIDGKPVVQVLDLGASYLNDGIKLDDRFAIRYTAVNSETRKLHERGFWSWMDLDPQVTLNKDGKNEAMTLAAGCFDTGGWKGKNARGHDNGATLVEDFSKAMQARPAFMQIHQFNEFAGQIEGQPAGQIPDLYVDCYSANLTDDIEPTAITTPAYRANDSWGFFYLNLMRQLIDLYKQQSNQETTVIVFKTPKPEAPGHSLKPLVSGQNVEVSWIWLGVKPESYDLYLNGEQISKNLHETSLTLDLSKATTGVNQLKLVANGAKTYYSLSWTEASSRLGTPETPSVEMEFVYE